MADSPSITEAQPLLVSGSVAAVVATGVQLATSFGLDLSKPQQAALTAFSGAVCWCAHLVWTHRKVSPS